MSVLRPGQENRAFDALKRKFYCCGGRSEAGHGFEKWGLAGGVVHELSGIRGA